MIASLVGAKNGQNGITVPSALASTLFGAGTSLAGIVAGLIAGSRLGKAGSSRLPIRRLLIPVGASAAVTVGAAYLLPTY